MPVQAMCNTLNVSASGYYGWRGRAPSARAVANDTLIEQIREVYIASDETYGMPRVRAELLDQGVVASRKRIARLMRQAKLHGVSRRRGFCITTKRDERQRPAPDWVNRTFEATAINPLWVADMTYSPTWAGFLFLATVIDVYSRKVVGWAFGETMTADWVILALNMAIMTRKPGSVIHHSDQGSQYTRIAFGNRCKEMGVRPSMGSVGDAYEREAWPRAIMPWQKASSPAWNVNSLLGAVGKLKPMLAWRCSLGSRVGTTRADAIPV